MRDPLSTLAWLIEAGADETIGDAPVNRFAPAPLNHRAGPAGSMPGLAGPASRSAAHTPVPDRAAAFASRGDQREGKKIIAPMPVQGDAIGTAMDMAGAATTLEELRTAMQAFEGCALKRTARNTVFADGRPGHVLFVGEAPGRDEDRVGKPFVGRAGQLLDKMMAAIGLSRDTNAYITNVINWRPPDNRDPSPEEAAQCLPFLRRHIELAEPKIIVLLGAVAARHVVGVTDGIMKLRGRWLDYRVGDRMVPVMPCLHPAYLLRQPAHKKLAWRDLQAVQARLESPI